MAIKPIAPGDLLDVSFYERQVGRAFASRDEAYAHFRDEGQVAGFMPSPYFYTSWYMWQNTDAAQFPTALDHLLAVARQRPLLSPAPFIEAGAFLAAHPDFRDMARALLALARGECPDVSPDLAAHMENLRARQKAAHGAVRSIILRDEASGRKNLVWVQSGASVSPRKLAGRGNRSWDLLCNWYDKSCIDLDGGEIHILQPGTKTTAIHHVLEKYPQILKRYDYVLFLDDDIAIGAGDIERLFAAAHEYGLALFQPALLPGSNGIWKDLFRKDAARPRPVSGVEIMMPGFSREALFACKEIFGSNVSGYGVDFMFSEHARRMGGKCCVVDAAGARHLHPINEGSGSYYRFMRSLGIIPHLELYGVIRELGAYPSFTSV